MLYDNCTEIELLKIVAEVAPKNMKAKFVSYEEQDYDSVYFETQPSTQLSLSQDRLDGGAICHMLESIEDAGWSYTITTPVYFDGIKQNRKYGCYVYSPFDSSRGEPKNCCLGDSMAEAVTKAFIMVFTSDIIREENE